MKVKDLVQGRIYAIPCPMNGYVLKPFIFDKIKPHNNFSFALHFIGIEPPNLILPIMSLYDNFGNIVDYGEVDIRPLTSLEMELL